MRPLHYFLSSKHTLSPTPPHYPFLPSPGLLPLASLETVLVHCRAFALVVLFAWITPPPKYLHGLFLIYVQSSVPVTSPEKTTHTHCPL